MSDTFAIRLGASVLMGDSNIELGFSEIMSDSRCPLDVVCIWAGAVAVKVWIKTPELDTLYFEPSTYSHPLVMSAQFGITFHDLIPYPVIDTTGYDVSDTVLTIFVEEFVPLLDQLVIRLVDGEDYPHYTHRSDRFDIDSVAVTNDTLLVHVKYSGGCNEHDFYTFGSLAWMESQPPVMPAAIVHNGHNDACDALIRKTLAIDLTPVTELSGYGNEVYIDIGPQGLRVHYSW